MRGNGDLHELLREKPRIANKTSARKDLNTTIYTAVIVKGGMLCVFGSTEDALMGNFTLV